ncbi:hypothetical protein M8013_11795 [Enterobacteriaceae bacterium H4N4]|uniref:Uncharacterized protein n=1 Tax=Silvania confinis TaxID=2926470 RepID=A0A9J6QFA0_9ENTR|nr:hypothetical protein [Silvania confinis]MCU6669428.1 hypothetical protein [Silvania confinis]
MKSILKTTRYTKKISVAPKPFVTELALVDIFSSLVKEDSRNINLEHEFDCGFGIADLVVFKTNKDDDLLDLGKIPSDWAYTLKALPFKKAFSLEYLTSLSGTSENSSKKALNKFIDAGYCIRIENNNYIKIRQPKPLCSSIIAIEAKLRDWKKALWQASRYKIFSNESWVVLDQYRANAAKLNIEEFKKFNIGLATVSVNGTYEEIFSPTPECHKSELAYWKANSLLAKKRLSLSSF